MAELAQMVYEQSTWTLKWMLIFCKVQNHFTFLSPAKVILGSNFIFYLVQDGL